MQENVFEIRYRNAEETLEKHRMSALESVSFVTILKKYVIGIFHLRNKHF